MMGESHLVLGAAATATYLLSTGHTFNMGNASSFLLATAFAGVIALLPDIDSPNTKIRQIFGVGSRQARRRLRGMHRKGIITNIFNIIRFILALILDVLAWILPHRGPTHWLIVFICLVYGMFWASNYFGWSPLVWQSFAIGYGSHLVGDACTKSGIKLFAPFYNKAVGLPFKFLRATTGTRQESVALAVLLLLMLGWLAYQNNIL